MTGLILALNRVFRRPNVGGRESAEAYSDWEHHWGKEFARMYMEPAGDLRGKHVLDVGCGLGGKTVAYAEAGALVTGTDLLENNVEQSRSYAKMKGARADFFVGDAAALPVSGVASTAVSSGRCVSGVMAMSVMNRFCRKPAYQLKLQPTRCWVQRRRMSRA